MNIIKFTAICSLSIFIILNAAIPACTTAADESKIGYGRGGRMSAGSESERSKEPIQPIPINFDYDRAKVELGKKLFFEPRLSKSGWIS